MHNLNIQNRIKLSIMINFLIFHNNNNYNLMIRILYQCYQIKNKFMLYQVKETHKKSPIFLS